MNKPARNLVEWVRASIRSLSLNPDYGTLDSVYTELAELSGLSKSIITKIYSGESMNPQVDTLDKLIAAIKAALRKIAA